MAKERAIPEPTPNPETQAFWDAARQGHFLVPHCRACGKSHWYPRAVCPHCSGAEIELREASGDGEVYSYSVMARAPEPYAIAYVRLAEGTTMMTNIVDCDFADIHVGMKVRAVMKATEAGSKVPMFTKA